MTKQTEKRIILLHILLLCISSGFNTHAQKQMFTGPTNFSDSVFDYSGRQFPISANFDSLVFKSTVLFFDSEFTLPVSFNKVRFENEVLFTDVNFQSGTKFSDALFEKEVEFTNAEFSSKNQNSMADFSNAEFKKPANFDNAKFYGFADFRYLKFNEVSFEKAEFRKGVDFLADTFFVNANFKEAVFDDIANFKFTVFKSDAIFKNAQFNGDVDFSSTVFSKRIDLSFVSKISDEIDLTMSVIPNNEPCSINLVGASIDKIRFRYKRFQLWFPEEKTNDAKSSLSLDYDLRASVYEAVLQKQKNSGFIESYEKLDKEYKEFKYTYSASNKSLVSWGEIQNWVDKHWWGYGYNKELIVINTIILYLLFSFLNVFFLEHMTRNVYNAEKINEYWDEAQSAGIKTFISSIPFSLFYTAQIFFGFKFDLEKLKYKENLSGWKIFNLVYFIIIFLSGLVCLAYLMNYVLTV